MESFSSPRSPLSFNSKCFEMLTRESFTDVTLVCDGRFMQAHKLVLAASSCYFEEIFKIIPDKHPAIVLQSITYTQLQLVMQYIYRGSVDVPSGSEVEEFKKILEMLKIEYEQDQSEADDDEESLDLEIIEPPLQDIIDVEDETWDEKGDVKVKEEPKDESEDMIAEVLDDYDETMIDEEQQREAEAANDKDKTFRSPHNDLKSRYVHNSYNFPGRFVRTPQKLIRVIPCADGKISVERVVPSKKFQQFMADNPLICPFCSKYFKTSKHRNEHVKYCFSNKNRIVSLCPLCKKSVCDPYYLRKHLRNVHGKAAESQSTSDTSIHVEPGYRAM